MLMVVVNPGGANKDKDNLNTTWYNRNTRFFMCMVNNKSLIATFLNDLIWWQNQLHTHFIYFLNCLVLVSTWILFVFSDFMLLDHAISQ